MKRLFEWICDHPWLVIVASFAATALAGYGLRNLRADANVENMLPDNSPAVTHAKRIKDVFAIEDSVVVAVVRRADDGVFNPQTLALVQDITKKLADVGGIDPAKIWSIFTVSDIVGDEGGFSVVPLSPDLPKDAAQIAALRERAQQNPLHHGSLVAKNGQGTLIYAGLTPVAGKAKVYDDVRHLIDNLPVRDEKIYVTGQPVVEGVIGRHVERDMGIMMPLVSLVIVFSLFLIFKSLRGVVIPLIIVLLSVVWAMGVMAYCDIPIYPMTTIIPILLMAMGMAYVIQVIACYDEALRDHPRLSKKQIIVRVMKEMWWPVIMAAITDAAGFMSLISTSMKPILYTGLFTTVGVIMALFFAIVLIPALMAVMPRPKIGGTHTGWGWADRGFAHMGRLIYRRRFAVIAVSLLLLAGSIYGMTVVNVDSDPMANFNPTDPIPISTKIIDELFSGTMIVQTTLESPDEKRFLDPETLRAVDAFQKDVAAIPEIGTTTSVVDLLKMMNRAMNADAPEAYAVPPTRNLVGTYLLLYSGDNLGHYINYGQNFINIETRITSTSTKVLERVLARMDEAAAAHFSGLQNVEVRNGGLAQVLLDLIHYLVWGQVSSLWLSIVAVLIMTALMFRSMMAGIYNILPITLSAALNFGIMALFRIPLEPGTAITSCIGIGVGIDYAIHFIAKYQLLRRQGMVGEALVEETMATTGKAIFFNVAVVASGFLVLLTAHLPPSRHMGFMVSINMFTSFVATVTTLPAILAWRDPKFCREGKAAVDGLSHTDLEPEETPEPDANEASEPFAV